MASYKEIERLNKNAHDLRRANDSFNETKLKLDSSDKGHFGNILFSSFFGFAAGFLAKVCIGGLLVAFGVAVGTAAILSTVGAVVIGVVVIGGILYYIYKD